MTGVTDLIGENSGAKPWGQGQPAIVTRAGAVIGYRSGVRGTLRRNECCYCGKGGEHGGRNEILAIVDQWYELPCRISNGDFSAPIVSEEYRIDQPRFGATDVT